MSTKPQAPKPAAPPDKGAWERIREQLDDLVDRLLGPRAPAPEPVPLRVRR